MSKLKVGFQTHKLARVALLLQGATLALTLLFSKLVAGNAQMPKADSGLVAHEWGTFTSVSGETGEAVEWLPLNGGSDLPSFVEHFRGTGFKVGLGGKLRMETPVIYFYSSRDTSVNVRVSFLHGLITEWYPRASHLEPSPTTNDASRFERESNGSITWTSVAVQPSAPREFPTESQPSHYYAARAVQAAPVRVAGLLSSQREQFLFYRGVSEAAPPLSAAALAHGRIEATNLADSEISLIIYFERRGSKAGFRQFESLHTSAILEPPVLDSSSPDSLRPILESALVSAGLYPAEARAMLETWHDSWFEEGSRLIYIVPSSFLSKSLPLSITPQPDDLQRVFVGRLELLTPATQSAIETAVAQHDDATLKKYGRFLAPFIEAMLRKDPASANAGRLGRTLTGIYDTYIARNR